MTPCILWSGVINPNGYGRVWDGKRHWNAHVLEWERVNGPVPEGMELDHLCSSRACVNVEHLEPVTHRENLLRSPNTLAGRNARKTHCPRGHEYAGSNLVIRRGRKCRACDRARKLVNVPEWYREVNR